MARGTHPKKEVRKALKELRAAGWTIEVAVGGHAHGWGTATCPHLHPGGPGGVYSCVLGIRSTPRNEGDHANRLRPGASQLPGSTGTIRPGADQ